jgi:hypothetical protein
MESFESRCLDNSGPLRRQPSEELSSMSSSHSSSMSVNHAESKSTEASSTQSNSNTYNNNTNSNTVPSYSDSISASRDSSENLLENTNSSAINSGAATASASSSSLSWNQKMALLCGVNLDESQSANATNGTIASSLPLPTPSSYESDLEAAASFEPMPLLEESVPHVSDDVSPAMPTAMGLFLGTNGASGINGNHVETSAGPSISDSSEGIESSLWNQKIALLFNQDPNAAQPTQLQQQQSMQQPPSIQPQSQQRPQQSQQAQPLRSLPQFLQPNLTHQSQGANSQYQAFQPSQVPSQVHAFNSYSAPMPIFSPSASAQIPTQFQNILPPHLQSIPPPSVTQPHSPFDAYAAHQNPLQKLIHTKLQQQPQGPGTLSESQELQPQHLYLQQHLQQLQVQLQQIQASQPPPHHSQSPPQLNALGMSPRLLLLFVRSFVC